MSMRIGEIVAAPRTIMSREVMSGAIDSLFHDAPELSHIVIVDKNTRPQGLLTRSSYYNRTGGEYGFHLFKNKHADVLARQDFLRFGPDDCVSEVAKRAMSRPDERLYDPVVVVLNGSGRLMGSVTIKELLENSDRELVLAKEEAERATRHKSVFLATMSHELRTPLNAVLNLTDSVLGTSLSATQRDRLEAVHTSGEHLLRVVSDILDFSKIEAGKLELETIDFDLAKLLRSVACAMRPLCEKKSLTFDLRVHADTPHNLKGDPTRLRQIIINLIGNAIKFTERGGVTIEVAPSDAGRGGSGSAMLEFTVKDTGMGIPKEAMSSLFTCYSQADKSVYRKYGGSGIGLAICRQLAELMGGRIWVDSLVGAGSSFHFTASFSLLANPEPDAAVQAFTNQMLPSIKVLAAEDSALNGKVLEALFECLGIKEYQIVADGAQALEALSKKSFDIVLMDIEMPIMDGFEATQRIRNGEAGEANWMIPVCALTAHATGDIRAMCFEKGMNGYLTKPLKLKEVHDTILMIARKGTKDITPYIRRPPPCPDRLKRFLADELVTTHDQTRKLPGLSPAPSH